MIKKYLKSLRLAHAYNAKYPHWLAFKSLFANLQTEKDIPYEPKDEELTCFKCSLKDKCEYAFDPYNTNGDCLAEK